MLGIIHQRWTTGSHRAPCPNQSMSMASWGWGMPRPSLARTLDPSPMEQTTLRNWELMLFPPSSPLFFLFPPPFLSQQPTGSKRPFAVVKATPYHEDGAVKWQQPRALLSISAASLARPRCRCQRCCSARAKAAPWESAGWAGGELPPSLPGPGPNSLHQRH